MKKINLKNSIIFIICFYLFGINAYASDNEWEFTNPEQEGVNSSILKKLSEEFKSGKHGYIDAFLLIRNEKIIFEQYYDCLLYTSPSPRDATLSRMPSSA